MTGDAPTLLKRARVSITSAVDLGATTSDVMLATVQGLRGHDHPVAPDRQDSRQLARLYPSLLGSAAEGEPTIAELMADEPPESYVPYVAPRAGDNTAVLVTSTPPVFEPAPARPKRHYPHRRAMTLRLEPAMWRRLRQAALDHDTHASDIIRAALERHLAYLDGQKRRAAAS